MTKTWETIFDLAKTARGLRSRTQQEELGNAVISAFSTGKPLVAEAPTGTGKSFAVLLPLIDKIISRGEGSEKIRGVISTENNSLLDQYVNDDLPFLASIYKGFTFRGLKGRSNYYCLNHNKLNSRGSKDAQRLEKQLSGRMQSLGEGERDDIEKFLKRALSDQEWGLIQGSSKGCSDFKCEPDVCFSALARARALEANIVVTNHAMIRVDADSRADVTEDRDNFLGPFSYLVIDEAHTLEQVLVDGWSDELTEWELNDMAGSITEGVVAGGGGSAGRDYVLEESTTFVHENLSKYLKNATKFYSLLNKDTQWNRVSDCLQLKFVRAPSQEMRSAMLAHENDGLDYLNDAVLVMGKVREYLSKTMKDDGLENLTGKDRKAVRKAYRNSDNLLRICSRMAEAMQEKTGTVMEYGVPYSVTVEGFVRRNGEKSIKFVSTPLDISERAREIWRERNCVLVSATLRDMTDGSFAYTKASLGVPSPSELVVDTPFDFKNNQVVYVTHGEGDLVDLPNAKYSFEELVDLLKAAKGRSLVLFTANDELYDATERLRKMYISGEFPYRVLAQDGIVSTKELTRDFREDESSVLLASKSFFTGKNFEGATLSQVIMPKYTLKQYNPLCRQQIAWWRSRGFTKWYEIQSLTTFRQAVGRGVRTETDRCVISLLDIRATDRNHKVFKTVHQAVTTLGSPVTRKIADVEKFLA